MIDDRDDHDRDMEVIGMTPGEAILHLLARGLRCRLRGLEYGETDWISRRPGERLDVVDLLIVRGRVATVTRI